MRFISTFLLCGIALFGQAKAEKDMCVPPPGGSAPALPAHLMTGQGTVHFPITTSNPQAQAFFDQGVAQMHSFWATEAERSFLQAAALDPEAPMPWWGVAMVAQGDYRPRFQIDTGKKIFKQDPRQNKSRSVPAAQKALDLAAAPGKASPVERLYIASIAARRLGNPSDPEEAYIQGLRAILAAYPNEIEAKTYLALHLMRGYELPSREPRGTSMEAVALLREMLITAPDHPGVHHYVIHGFEGSSFAKDAWPSCRRYAELVTNIPHALHMPGHIYSQTGRWEDAVRSFSDAAENERGYIQADSLYGTSHHGHNVHYLATAYSFQGRYDDAKKAAAELLALPENPREAANLDGFYDAHRQGWFAMMRTLVQGERWSEILDGHTLPVYGKPREQAWRHWAVALAYLHTGDVAAGRAEAKEMDAALNEFHAKVGMPAPEVLSIARAELDGQMQLARHKESRGFKQLEAAAERERHAVYSEPPFYPRPVLEALGESALASGKPALAEDAFRRALEQYPASYRAQTGLRAALERQHKTQENKIVNACF